MLATAITSLGAIVTILGPILTAWVVAWADAKREERHHATRDEADEAIKKVLTRDPVGLMMLSRQLERLHKEAERKRRA